MSSFDHVRCSACQATLDPESLATAPGQGMSCPQCRAPLSLKDLFGVKDAFVGVDEDGGNDMSLDALFEDSGQRSAYARSPLGTPQPGPTSRPAPRRPAATTQRPLVPRASPTDSRDDGPSDALAAMRALKKR